MANIERVSVDISDWTPHVDNQREEGICYAMAVADMVGTSYRMKAYTDNNQKIQLTLSPQPLIDQGCRDDAYQILTNPHKGLQTIEHYPFTRLKSDDGARYRATGKRYGIVRGTFRSFERASDVERALASNFGRNGNKWPVVASIRLGRLARSYIARRHFYSEIPYRHNTSDQAYMNGLANEPYHAVLIVGMDNMSADPMKRSLTIKNSHGLGYGVEGKTKIGFEMVEELNIIKELADW